MASSVVPHLSHPQQQITITHNTVDYVLSDKTHIWDVTLRENAVASAQLTLSDYESTNFVDKVDIGDNVKVEARFTSGAFTQLFGGWITDVTPNLSMQTGDLLNVTALGYGQALVNMLVRDEFGTQSNNPTLNKIQEVITDATHGIIPKYVNKVMASATDSGYSIDTTKVADLASDFQYLYFPGKPASKCLEDMIDLIAAANQPAAGAHWTVVPSGTTAYLCVATVGNHENPPADVWPTYWNTTQAASTIIEGLDIKMSGFQKKRSEANYIFYYGKFRRPANGDIWTNNNSGDWAAINDAHVDDEAAVTKVGTHSIRGRLDLAAEVGSIRYPSTDDLNMDIDKVGTELTVPHLGFYYRRNAAVPAGGTEIGVYLGTGARANNDYFLHYLTAEITADNEWFYCSFPIGSYYRLADSYRETSNFVWAENGAPDWGDIDYIAFTITSNAINAYIYVDGLSIEGILTRAAHDSGKYAAQKCKMMFINDDLPKDDSLEASDDSGQIAQLCLAELCRGVTTPIIGQIEMPMRQIIKGGQLAHVHAERKAGYNRWDANAFRIDKDMRILSAKHHFGPPPDGATTTLIVTDDVINSHPIQPTDYYNAILKAAAPQFQDRIRGSLIAGRIDITQTLLEKDYNL